MFTSNISADGGTESNLYFAVLGDCRPDNSNDTPNYPTATITMVHQAMDSMTPRPPFAVATGDYQYCDDTSDCSSQIQDYLTARNDYRGVEFFGMGNHECTGYTNSDCGSGNPDGVTPNYTAFTSILLSQISRTLPYYSFNVSAADSSWTAKFVVIAANAWDSTQASWLDSAMAPATSYTFVVRHEPSSVATQLAAVGASESILANYPITLKLEGHTHAFEQATGVTVPELIAGNAGVPGTTGPFGYGLVERQADGSILVTQIDASTNLEVSSFTVPACSGNGC